MVLAVSDFYRIQARGNNALRLSYVEWIDQWIEQGRRPYLMTFMFNRMAASSMNLFVEIMYRDIEIAYRRLSGRFAHHPEKPGQRDKLPIFIGAPDTPSIKRRNHQFEGDDRLHVHGVLLTPAVSRFEGDLVEWMKTNAERLIAGTRIRRIHLVEITRTPHIASDYALKAFGWHPDFGDPLILPMQRGVKRDRTAKGYDEACNRVQGCSLVRPRATHPPR